MQVVKMMQNNAMTFFKIRIFIIAVTITNLTACNNDDFSDLHAYIASVKARPKSAIKSLPDFEAIEPFVFNGDKNLRDPFKLVEKMPTPEEQVAQETEPDNGIHPDVNRVKEPLEVFSLSGLKMVGTINMGSTLWGLIKADGNNIYRVKKGDYLGKNDGKIIQIDKKKIELIEILPSNPGRFVEQSTTLTLVE